jgi:NitT/TauT family transport system permease protein
MQLHPILRAPLAVIVTSMLWEAAARYFQDPILVPSLLPLMRVIVQTYLSGQFWVNAWASLQSFVAGYVLAGLIGVPLGLTLGTRAPVRRLLGALVATLSVSPVALLVPLLTLWLGFGIASKIAVAFLAAIFPLASLIATEFDGYTRRSGASSNGLPLMSEGRGAVINGLRAGVTPAIVAVIVGEFYASQVGLGTLMMAAAAELNVPQMIAIFMVASLPSLVLDKFLRSINRHV